MDNKTFFILFIMLLSSCTISSNAIYDEDIGIETYFCPQDHCMEKMISVISSGEDIRCAFYELNLPELIDILKEKNAEVVIEDDNALPGFISHYSSALMHNKFCIIDNSIVMSGSMNPTERGNYYNNNNLVVIRSKALAQNYLDEFDELKEGIHGKGAAVKSPSVRTGDRWIENYFCPEDHCKYHVIQALESAQDSIYFMAFSFTDEDIGNLLWNKEHQGLDLRGVLEKRQLGTYSRYEDLKDFTLIDQNAYTMHHKVFIIDNRTVITGSYNPTKNADEKNDENIVIIHDKAVASSFIREFENMLDPAYDKLPESEGSLRITEVIYDPPGNDEGNEYIMLENTGDEYIDLSYFFISDNKTNSRLDGSISPYEKLNISPSFALKNKGGIVVLKDHLIPIDISIW